MFPFTQLVIAHVITGTVGLVSMWVPVVGRKGAARHKRWGKVFAISMLVTGTIAIGISICTLIAPLETHPFSDDAPLIRGIFGWMMLYLAVMTIMLAYYGLECIRNKRDHQRNARWLNLTLQAVTFVAAVNCAWRGWQLGQPLMLGISVVGIAASVLNTRFILQKQPPLNEWLIQHTRGLVGAGISVYTAFLAFGAVNYVPAIALNPALWAVPTTLGVGFLLYHQHRIVSQRRRIEARTGGVLRPGLADTE